VDLLKNTGIWKMGVTLAITPGMGYVVAAVAVVGVSVYVQHKLKKAKKDEKLVKYVTHFALGVILVEAFMDAISFAVRTFL
jgi:hypothetical protein